MQRDKKQREIDSSNKKLAELETVFVQIQNEWKEELFSWNGKNQKIHLDQEQLQQLSLFAQEYRENTDYTKVLEIITEVWSQAKGKLEAQKQEVLKRKMDTESLLKQEIQQLREWENDKEPEPKREEEVIQNRKQLQELGVPYQEFYKVIEFGKELKEEECNQLEEALLRMGILDALLIDEQYREKVLSLKNGTCDRYLFVQKHRAEKSVLDVLDVNENVNDLFHNQKIISILQNIAYDSEGMTAILKNGSYQIGVLTGTLTGSYKAGFLGTQAREKNRKEQIVLCKQEIEKLEAEIEQLIETQKLLEEESRILMEEYRAFPKEQNLKTALQMLVEEERILDQKKETILKIEEEIKEIKTLMGEQKTEVLLLAEKLYLSCNLSTFLQAEKAANDYEKHLLILQSLHQIHLQLLVQITDYEEQMENLDMDLEQIRYEQQVLQKNIKNDTEEWKSVTEQLQLTDYEKIKERMQICLEWLKKYPSKMENCIREETSNQNKLERCIEEKQNKLLQSDLLKQKQSKQEKIYEAEASLDYVDIEKEIIKEPTKVWQSLLSFCESQQKDTLVQNLNKIYFENRGFLTEYQLAQTELFAELEESLGCMGISRMDLCAKYKGTQISSKKLLHYLEEEIEELESLIHGKDRELFEDILANTVSRKIRGKINASNTWVGKMNQLMNSMNTSSGLVLSLRWRSKTAEQENQLDTKELVDLLKKDYRVMKPEEAEKLSNHFRSKVNEARRHAQDSNGSISFYQVMRDTLDYRKWFEFQLFYQKAGERMKELTNSMFGTFSGGEKAMSMYVPLFSAVVAKYQSCSKDAPRLISLDEAFAGVDNRNIRDMFRLMTEFEFDFIINSQVLWGDCDTLDALAIYQLQRPLNAKFVTVMPYLWNGKRKELLEHEREMEERRQA